MKITIQPTGNPGELEFYHGVTIEKDGNDHDIVETFDLIEYALKAWGFTESQIDEYLGGGGNQ